MYAWWRHPYRYHRTTPLPPIQAVSLLVLSVVGLPLFGIGFLLFTLWLMAAVLSHPNIAIFVLFLAFCGLFVKK